MLIAPCGQRVFANATGDARLFLCQAIRQGDQKWLYGFRSVFGRSAALMGGRNQRRIIICYVLHFFAPCQFACAYAASSILSRRSISLRTYSRAARKASGKLPSAHSRPEGLLVCNGVPIMASCSIL